MKKSTTLLTILCFWLVQLGYGQEDSLQLEALYQQYADSINQSFQFQHGEVSLQGDLALLKVPKGYKYLDAEQSKYVMADLWGNPPSECLGMLFPEETYPLSDHFTYAIEITYSEDGYIEDEDAQELDYDELMEEMKSQSVAINEARIEQGYGAIELVGWASSPFYDSKNKKLHWAKELKFESDSANTLNYNIRILGRKGYLNLNVIGEMDVLPMVKQDIDPVLASVDFKEGYRYSEFNPDIDQVAAYGVGGLIAGKVLSKVGFLAVLAKFWKFIAIAAVGLISALRKKIAGIFSGN
ncbi:DUF2167 domain-containing protein [Rapidithrix thailandica]|uniref:DUF2167 domain-containing protein n=1 Tax=Rapidithrix thailandica TaxID=413964 RepID=A0AAW9SDH9_9BACT